MYIYLVTLKWCGCYCCSRMCVPMQCIHIYRVMSLYGVYLNAKVVERFNNMVFVYEVS